MTNSTRKLLIILGIVLIIGAVRFLSVGSSEDAELVDSLGEVSSVEVETERVLFNVQKINNLKLDATFFEDKRFITLEDFGVTIADVRTGRTNPFIPVQE